ncbi:MAG: efflux RND transporter periplasmic adaptor subunit [Thermoanaerobaculia bacterium]
MNRPSRIVFAAAFGASFLLIGYLGGRARHPSSAVGPAREPRLAVRNREVLYWYDPMKPELHFDHPGRSPFMDMDLVAKYADEKAGAAGRAPLGSSVVRIPLERRQEIGVTTVRIGLSVIRQAIETSGVVAEDERRVHSVNAKFSGYVERLYVDQTGQTVRKGRPLLSIYSPDLVATERELLLAVENVRRLSEASDSDAASDARALLESTRQRLRFWDISGAEIRRIEATGEVSKDLVLPSPVSGIVLKKDALPGMAVSAGEPLYTVADLSEVWVLADLYQSELGMTAPGDEATLNTSFLPGEKFVGRVDFVYPTLAEATRTVKVRIVIPNPNGALKPGMFVRVALTGKGKEVLAVPRSALIQTGERQIAFVEESPGVYAPREVKTGMRGVDSVEVLSGLSDGERVVVSANFLIDSESQIGAVGQAPAGSSGQPAQPLTRKPEDSQEQQK